MDHRDLLTLLEQVRAGTVSVPDALERMRRMPFEVLEEATVDWHRTIRLGFPEVIFCAHKSPAEAAAIFRSLAGGSRVVLATRAGKEHYSAIREQVPDAVYREEARAVVWPPRLAPAGDASVALITAGSSDRPVAEEAAVTLEALGIGYRKVYDVGVAGIHRLVGRRQEWEDAAVLIVFAGMEGALPSVVGGLTHRPVIAVPTSVGYGAHLGGLTPLLAMLSSCAPGVVVTNIDNGFGAAFAAARILGRLQGSGAPA